jgi:hypothetical protein
MNILESLRKIFMKLSIFHFKEIIFEVELPLSPAFTKVTADKREGIKGCISGEIYK